MERQYAIGIHGQQTGKVCVLRSGLYYHFHCRCVLPSNDIFRLIVCCGTNQENLGVLVPVGTGFGLDTKLPVRKIGEGTLSFLIIPKRNHHISCFAPILDEEPFAYITRLKESFLLKKDGQLGICIQEKQEC